jgi:hypothetical protein
MANHPAGSKYGIIVVLSLLPWASAQPISRQMEQQRRAQAELRESERRIAASQAEEIRKSEERAEQQRRAQAESERRREAEERREELLLQRRAEAQQSNTPQPQEARVAPHAQPQPQEAAAAPAIMSAPEPLPHRYLLMRQIGLVLMIGASIGALLVLGRIVQERLPR